MLWPSAIIAWMAGTPSPVAGIFTNRFGWAIRWCSWRAAAMVASVSRASSGATSTDTNPSLPALASKVGPSTPRASAMSSVTRSQ